MSLVELGWAELSSTELSFISGFSNVFILDCKDEGETYTLKRQVDNELQGIKPTKS
jgi:hypothetical protein